MTTMIDGFSVEPQTSETFMFKRTAVPQHEYEFRLTSEHVGLIQTMPAPVDHGDPGEDAERFEIEAAEAAKKYRDHLFGSAEAAE